MSTVETQPQATKKVKKLFFCEFTADLFDGKPRRFSSYVLATDRWRARDGLSRRIGTNIRNITVRRSKQTLPAGVLGGEGPVLEVE